MKVGSKLAFAALLATVAAAPATADESWTYRGGPKGPPSLSGPTYTPDYAYYGGYYSPDVGPGYGAPYAYSEPASGGYGYGNDWRANEPLYRCRGPATATSDCYTSRALQGSR
jgi:hypothetical protein